MNNQEAFDLAVGKLLEQGATSENEDGSVCMYRGQRGRRCAIGWLIPDDQYTPSLERKMSWEVQALVPALEPLNTKLLEQLQDVHDIGETDQWRKQFKRVAEANALTWNFGAVE